MKTYPLHSISFEEAKQLQFKVIDAVTRNFDGMEVLSLGDLGVVKGLNKPSYTQKVESLVVCLLGRETVRQLQCVASHRQYKGFALVVICQQVLALFYPVT